MIHLIFLSTLQIVSSLYSLVWSDEFTGPVLDTTKWDYEINCWGGGNNEKQCYVNDPKNLYIENGKLVIHPIYYPEGYTGNPDDCTNNNENSCTWTQPATSARIRTVYSQSWKYGRFEFRAKLPSGNFLWPAIWMLPTYEVYGAWAASGEIDIVEFRGQPSQYNILDHTLHFGGKAPNNTWQGSGPVVYKNKNFTDDFHIFVLEWTDQQMVWFVDDDQGFEMSLNRSFYSGRGPNPYTGPYQPFDQEFHLILNVAISGNFFPSDRFGVFNPANDSETWLSDFQMDYIRIYQDLNPSTPPSEDPLLPGWVYVIIGVLVIVILLQAFLILRWYRRREEYMAVH